MYYNHLIQFILWLNCPRFSWSLGAPANCFVYPLDMFSFSEHLHQNWPFFAVYILFHLGYIHFSGTQIMLLTHTDLTKIPNYHIYYCQNHIFLFYAYTIDFYTQALKPRTAYLSQISSRSIWPTVLTAWHNISSPLSFPPLANFTDCHLCFYTSH